MAIHTFDAARFLAGKEPEGVYCREWEPKNSWYRRARRRWRSSSSATASIFNYRGSWCADGLAHQLGERLAHRRQQGTLVWDGHDDIRAEVAGAAIKGLFSRWPPSRFLPSTRPTGPAATSASCRISSPRRAAAPKPETVGHQNIRSLAMVFGAIESATDGRQVGDHDLDDALARIVKRITRSIR